MIRILLGVDGSAGSLAAVDHVIALAASGLECWVNVVAAVEPVYLYEMVLPPDNDVLDRWTAVAGRKALEQAQSRLHAAQVPLETELATGDPAQALLDAATRHGCDLIVLGARGLGPVKGLLLGSVSQAVLVGSHVPVTIAHQVSAG